MIRAKKTILNLKRNITTLVHPNPSKLPNISPHIYHKDALEKALSKTAATGVKQVLQQEIPFNAPETWVYNLKFEPIEVIKLDPYFFDCSPRKDILHKMVVWQLAKKRQGTHRQQYRLEVAFTKKKLYRQKGTGGARHQDRGAPIFLKGGRAFPKRPRDYSFKLNKKVRFLALRMALTTKYLQGKLFVVDELKVEIPKTKIAVSLLRNMGINKEKDAMLIDSELDKLFERSTWNLFYVHYGSVAALNVYDLLRRDYLVVTKRSLEKIAERWSKFRNLVQ